MNTRIDNLLKLAENTVAYGRKKGANQIEVLISEGNEFSVDVREGNIERLVEAASKELSLKVIVDQKTASASSSDLSEDTLRRLVENAVERARLASADPNSILPEKVDVTTDGIKLRLFDPKIPELTPEYKILAAKQTEKICLADPRVRKSYGASFGSTVGGVHLVNSNGFSGSYSRSGCSCGVYLQAGEGDNLIDEGWFDSSIHIDSLMNPEALAKKAVHRVTRLIGARKIDTQNVPVVFEQPMTDELLGFLYRCVAGNGIYLRQSFLADKLNTKIGNERITVVDDGLIPGAPGSRPFDREGVPTRKTVVIEKGILRNYLLDTYSARKLRTQSTGNASGANNFHMEAGTSTPDDIVRTVDKGLFLTGTIGFGLVPTTGDISRGAFGLWIEKGEIAFPVAEITISGNLGQILNNVELVGNDLEFKRPITGPTIKVAEMTIGGK